MAGLAIVQVGTPVLRERAQNVAVSRMSSPEFAALCEAMVETMREAPGVGLAAPQVGLGLRMFVMEDKPEYVANLTPEENAERERDAVPLRIFVNPALTPIGDAKVGFFEGCLSVEGYVGYVQRYAEVEVTGLDEKGQPQTMRARGWPARILQHEFDHLEGTLYIDRMLTRSFSESDLFKAVYGNKSIAEIRELLGVQT
ncbi:MAG TPA: peptide deformylase [Myxococcales bacterium]|jgi:peptide deformylase|nr:peptide deformylase [Myxococcales bacterium]